VLEYDRLNAYKNRVKATMEGELAFNEGFYHILNKKDKTEANESVYKGWIPFVAIILSSISLLVTILNIILRK
jgi:hypothetical protein